MADAFMGIYQKEKGWTDANEAVNIVNASMFIELNPYTPSTSEWKIHITIQNHQFEDQKHLWCFWGKS